MYKYVKRLLNTKVDYEGFTSTNFVDRAPLVSGGNQHRNLSAGATDGFMQPDQAAHQTFDFDSSEVCGFGYDDFEEYTGPG